MFSIIRPTRRFTAINWSLPPVSLNHLQFWVDLVSTAWMQENNPKLKKKNPKKPTTRKNNNNLKECRNQKMPSFKKR